LNSDTSQLLASLVFLSVSSILTCSLLFWLHRLYRRSYLRQWRTSWAWLAVYHSMAAVSLAINTFGGPASFQQTLPLSALVRVGGCLHVVFFLLGAWELRQEQSAPRRWVSTWVTAAVVLGVVLALLFSWDRTLIYERLVARAGARALLVGVTFVGAGFLLRGLADRTGVGYRLLAGSTVAYGLYGFILFGLTVMAYLNRATSAYQGLFGFLEALPQTGIAAGMVIVLLEEERASAIHRAHQVQHLAYHDPLTGLPNRSLFLDRLKSLLTSAPRRGFEVAVAFLDLDLFKRINDSRGHAVGDELMLAVAQRLRLALRAGDTVARMGGDEFTLLLEVRGREEAEEALSRVLHALRQPIEVQGAELIVTASAGFSITSQSPTTPEDLLRRADLALYRAKQEGKDLLRFFDGSPDDDTAIRLSLELALRRAVETEDQFVLHYQPLFDADARSVVGVEALVRWRQSNGHLRMPGEFIPLAETSGLIVPLGHWVIQQACRQAAIWRRSADGAHARPLKVAINLSARQLTEPNLAGVIGRALAASDLPGSVLQVEITELVAMRDVASADAVLSQLHELGITVALDDFGTGYSSLAHLQGLAIDELKIDASFVRTVDSDSGAEAIVRAILSLGKELRLGVTAEGVETAEQLAALFRLGCPQLQGFYLGRPMSAEDIDPLILGHARPV
jgi:diguanylate cyclase (GGDEF)-like protein